MRRSYRISLSGNLNKENLVSWAGKQSPVVILDSNRLKAHVYPDPYKQYDLLIGVGGQQIQLTNNQVFDSIDRRFPENPDWMFGYFGYDLKNETERLSSENNDYVGLDDSSFFCPDLVFLLCENHLTIQYLESGYQNKSLETVIDEIKKTESIEDNPSTRIHLTPKISKAQYVRDVKQILDHIQRGDIYELNYCMQFEGNSVEVNPFWLYQRVRKMAPTPFSAYLSIGNNAAISASPERFLQKKGSRLVSQPIKGTRRRGSNEHEDKKLIRELLNDPKERAENVMIVDLVRNDLSRTAAMNSVKVTELCQIYTFPQVHQMISTIESKLDERLTFTDAIRCAFPMGSMTGAPKIRAMELIEKFEHSKRGVYSGAIGYITPEGDFDFNVVIRTMLYNLKSGALSYSVGGAITALSNPEDEYQECLVKAQTMLLITNQKVDSQV